MAGSSNFQQWNPGLANQENDAQYTANTQRSGGAVAGPTPFPSVTANKLFYQLSIFVAAFAQMLANKGFTVSDANFTNLVAELANVITTADAEVQGGINIVAFSSTPVFNTALGTTIQITLTGNVTASALANYQHGQIITFIIAQDGTDGRTFVWQI